MPMRERRQPHPVDATRRTRAHASPGLRRLKMPRGRGGRGVVASTTAFERIGRGAACLAFVVSLLSWHWHRTTGFSSIVSDAAEPQDTLSIRPRFDRQTVAGAFPINWAWFTGKFVLFQYSTLTTAISTRCSPTHSIVRRGRWKSATLPPARNTPAGILVRPADGTRKRTLPSARAHQVMKSPDIDRHCRLTHSAPAAVTARGGRLPTTAVRELISRDSPKSSLSRMEDSDGGLQSGRHAPS
jgi:hypothetical protein